MFFQGDGIMIGSAGLSLAVEEVLMRFKGKVALVTGSSRGIGRTIALSLAGEGADIVVNFFRNREPAEETANEIRQLGRRAEVIRANVGELDELESLFAGIEEKFGGLDFFISNAASGYNRPVLEQRPKGWEWTMNINARALLFGAQHAAPLMQARGGGAIVSLSSPGAIRVVPDYVVVGASKAALESITRYLGVEFAPLGIRVNAVSPGLVETEALKHFNVIQENVDIIEHARRATPVGRLVTPEDVANLVAFLCSKEAEMICGQTIIIDGGFHLPAEPVESE
jgi:enoyl-[acyl-carrier protein] reductase III